MNVEGTRRVVELRRALRRGSSASATSRPPTWPASRAASSARTSSTSASASATPTSARSSRPSGCSASAPPDLPLQVLRPSIVVGDSRTGRTSSFNVLYGPLKAFARGAIPAIPARRSSPVDIVPGRLRGRPRRTSSPRDGPGRHLPPRRRPQRHDRRPPARAGLASSCAAPAPTVLPPRLYRRCVHPWLRRKYRGLRRHGGLLPLLLDARALRRPRASARARRWRATSTGSIDVRGSEAGWGRRVPFPA